MRDFVLLFKLLYKNHYAGIDDGRTSGKVAMFLSIVPLFLILTVALVFVTMLLHDIRSLAALANVIVTAVQILTLLLSLGGIVSMLYSSKDIPLLASLPLRASTVFMAKFSLLYINALKFSSALLIPMLLTATITFNVVNKSMFYGVYPLIFLAIAVAPVLPLFIVTLFSMPIVWIGSYFKGKSTLKSIFTILFYILIVMAYFVLVYYAQVAGFEFDGENLISESTLAGLSAFANIMYPNKVLLSFCFGIDFGKNFGISLAITAGMVALMILLAVMFYRRINIRKSETNSDGMSVNTALKQTSIVMSLIKRDFKIIIRNSGLAMTSFANILMAPAIIVLMGLIVNKKAYASDEMISPLMPEMMKIGFVLMYSMIFLGGANALSSMAYTREGGSFFASKALPIKAKDSIKAKFCFSVIVAGVALIPILIIAIALYRIGIVSVLISGLDIMLVVFGISGMNIVFDMRKGNQHWKDSSELRYATRGNTYQLISGFTATIPAVAIFAFGMVLSAFDGPLTALEIKAIYLSVSTLISAVICTVGLLILKKYGEKYFEIIGENKPKFRSRRHRYSGNLGGGFFK